MMYEFALQDHGTIPVMLDMRDLKAWVPFHTTGFLLNSSLGMTKLQGGRSHTETIKGTHEGFTDGKIGKEGLRIDALRAEDIVY